ncbi:MAG: LacI family DNA-binding transcriptional regulator [Lachnospiraceae bacterium]|nr:LacI family DNA-binding transcriptional regulator [Lachnospiraceae bacterium]
MNIYDIAEKSGVSIATVSRVLNGSDKVSEKTKEKVMKVMSEEDYTPNIFARGLSGESTRAIGVLVPDISDNYMSRAVAFIERRLHEKDYNMLLSCSGFRAKEKEDHIRMLLEERIDAMILVGSTYAGSETISHNTDCIKKAALKKPMFLINGDMDAENIFCTFSNDYAVSLDLTKSLIENGRKKILFLTDSESYSANKKRAGYEQALSDAGIAVSPSLMCHIRNNIEETAAYLEELRPDFDACFATDDAMAVGVLKYAMKHGIRVPQDLSVIGYNNSELALATTPELTSVDNKLEKICDDTVIRLFSVLSGNSFVPRRTSVACTVVKRDTTNY